MKKRISLLLSLLFVFALAACGADSSSNDSVSVAQAPLYDYNADKSESGFVSEMESGFTSVDSSIYMDTNAKIIRTAELTIQTTDFDQSTADLAALTEELGGYYESAQIYGGGYYDQYSKRTASYVVRIPKENFTAFRDRAGKVGHVFRIQEGTQNVGEVYYDTEARLATLETKRERLLALLDKADLMEDIISLENALEEVQYEIDMHNTTLRKYDSLIDYSTFEISLEEVVKITQEPTPEDSFLTKLGVSFRNGFERFADGLQALSFWAARNIIALGILAAVIVVVIKVFRRCRKKRRAVQSEKDQEK